MLPDVRVAQGLRPARTLRSDVVAQRGAGRRQHNPSGSALDGRLYGGLFFGLNLTLGDQILQPLLLAGEFFHRHFRIVFALAWGTLIPC